MESAFELVLNTDYTLSKLREDICRVNNFDNPLRPKYLLLPAGLGKAFVQDVEYPSTWMLAPRLSFRDYD